MALGRAAMTLWLALFTAGLTLCGLLVGLAGAVLVQLFAARPAIGPAAYPAVTVLKPLCGAEPLLDQALASICRQDYPRYQIVFGVQAHDDPALRVVTRLRADHPDLDIAVVSSPGLHGRNRKISNLINMLPAARHDVLVFSDSDLHVPADYLRQIVAALERPGTGLVTTLCAGLPTVAGPAARLGAMAISHLFLPGALLARALGRQDCLGTTMALKREVLAAAGGLNRLAQHVADDNVLGQLVRRQGLRVALAATVPLTAVPECSLRALWQHELRWARTIRGLEPVWFAVSVLQFPIFWAAATLLFSDGATWAVELLAAAWSFRALAARLADRALLPGRCRRGATPAWLLPLRDALSVGLVAASYLGARVVWRGQVISADNGRHALKLPRVQPAAH